MIATPKVVSSDQSSCVLTPKLCISAFANALIGEGNEILYWNIGRPSSIDQSTCEQNTFKVQLQLVDRSGVDHSINAALPLHSTDVEYDAGIEQWRVACKVVEVEVDCKYYLVCWGISRNDELCVWYIKKSDPQPHYWIEFREPTAIHSERSLAYAFDGCPVHPERI